MLQLLERFYNPAMNLFTLMFYFYEDANETASDEYNNLVTRLKGPNIDTKYHTSYCAGNPNVNYGCHNSVFQLLYNDSNNVVPVGCPTHIFPNSVKYTLCYCNMI